VRDKTVISARQPMPGLGLKTGNSPLESASLLEGERLGQFVLQKFIGGGGMGVVFRALDTTLNREVAVKVLSRDQSTDDEALRRFRNEAQSAARLDHDNIARVHYVGEDRGVHYIVFEFIEGVNLRDRVEQLGPLSLSEAVSFTYQIAQALAHSSHRDVIHRDIKPSNVLITPDGKAKLVDMGLARLNQVAQADNDLTASGVTLGTFDYISPEQARDPRSADVRSDLYSLGCSFFYMLTGRPPFPEGTVLQKLLQHQADVPPDARTLRPDLPVEVTWILNRLLAKNPAQRYQQADELSAELATLAEKLGMQLSSGRTPVAPLHVRRADAPWRRHLPWALPTAALFLIVLALDYSWSTSEPEGLSVLPAAPVRELPGARNGSPARNGAATRPATKQPDAEKSQAASAGAARTAPGVEPRSAAPSPTTPVPMPDRDTAGPVSPAKPSQSTVVPQDPAESPGGGAPAFPDTSAPWLRRFAKSIGAELNLDELTARAAAASAASESKTPEANSSNASNPTDPQPRDQNNAVVPSVGHEGLLVVSPGKEGQYVYSSLRAACNHAKSGDVIELRFNGRLQEVPITISNSRLTIRAGENFQPIVAFRPEPNPVKFPPSMINVAGGQLRATNVHWELDVPRDLPGDWALFEARSAELLRFEGCSFTIRNASLGQSAYHAGVAFFEIKAPPGAGSMAMPPMGGDDTMVTIDLQNCVARGEATFLRDNDLQPLRLHWSNGLLATSERFLVAAGGPNQPRQQGAVQLNLQHVTLATRSGLALLTNSEDAPYQLQTEINCTNCILAVSPAAPLVDQRGPDAADEYLARVQWSGDHDAFDALTTFWKIQSGATQSLVRQMDFDQWQQHWASRSKPATNDPIGWKRPLSVDRPFHAQTPADYALDTALGDNPAVATGANEVDLGLIAEQLSPLPAGDPVAGGSESGPTERPSDGS